MRYTLPAALGVAALVVVGGAVTADAAAKPVTFKNCTAMHQRFPHGVGLPTARDKVRGKTKPVTTFYKSKPWYVLNTRLDADRDGIACEKR